MVQRRRRTEHPVVIDPIRKQINCCATNVAGRQLSRAPQFLRQRKKDPLPAIDGAHGGATSNRQTGIPILRALSASFSTIHEPGKAITPIGAVSSNTSMRLKGAN